MGEYVSLTASDGHRFTAWHARPNGVPKGGVIVLQEIFGLTDHIQQVTETFSEAGYEAIAPALFDRIETGVKLEYTNIERGLELKNASPFETCLLDIQAALAFIAPHGKSAVVGYCWGGTLAYLAACQLPIAASVASRLAIV